MGSAETVDGLLEVLRTIDAPEEIPLELVSAQGIGRLLEVSPRQVGNWLGVAGEAPTRLPFGPHAYYGWETIRHLVPPLRVAETSPVPRVLLDRLPGGSKLSEDDSSRAYARFLQLLLVPAPDRAHVPFDWEDPVDPKVLGWLGGAACDRLERTLRGRRSLVAASSAVELVRPRSMPLQEQAGVDLASPELEPDEADLAATQPETLAETAAKDEPGVPVTEIPAPQEPAESAAPVEKPVLGTPLVAAASSTSENVPSPRRGLVSEEPEISTDSEPQRRRAAVTKIFDRSLTHNDLYRLGVDSDVVDAALLQLRNAQDGSLSEFVDGKPIYRGTSLHKVLITLFGLQAADAAEYLGARPGLIENYVGSGPGRRLGEIRNASSWDAVLREFRPDMVEYTPMPDNPPGDYGFGDTQQLLDFVLSHGGDFEFRDEHILLSHSAQELLAMQLTRDMLPSALDETCSGWQSTQEMAKASGRVHAEVVTWARALPTVVGYLDSSRRTWLRSRDEPYRALPHYSPAVGTLFGHIAAQRSEDERMEERRERLYYPQRSRVPAATETARG